MKFRYGLAALAVLLIAAAAFWFVVPQRAVERLLGGRRNVETVAHPEQVKAYRVGPLPEKKNWQDVAFSEYPITSGPIDLSAATAAKVSAALVSPKTYLWDLAKSCIPVYGVQLSFFRRAERVDVLLCFECDILLVGRNGETVSGEDFDNSRAVLVRAVKEAFPSDDVIQQLKEERERIANVEGASDGERRRPPHGRERRISPRFMPG